MTMEKMKLNLLSPLKRGKERLMKKISKTLKKSKQKIKQRKKPNKPKKRRLMISKLN